MAERVLPSEARRVAITGLGCLSAAGSDVESHWRRLATGEAASGPVPAWLFPTELDFPVFTAPRESLTPRGLLLLRETAPELESGSLSRTLGLTVSAAAEALEQARLEPGALRRKRVGIALGTTVGCTFNDEAYYLAWRQGERPPLAPVLTYLGHNLAAALHSVLGTRGPAAVVTNACASGTDAIGVARNWLAAGLCDLAIAGGADELSRVAYNGFTSLQLTAAGSCRPFDRDRQGLNLGEGAGLLVLENQDQAAARGAEPLGLIRGYGSAADAWHPTAPHPEGRGLQQAFSQVLAEAGEGFAVSLVNAHGTGTRANDQAETAALAACLPAPHKVPIVSTKGITGHTLGAAGGIEAIFTLLALRAGTTPGTPGCTTPDPSFALSPLPAGSLVALAGNQGISQSLAFGGGNAILALEAVS